jgi:phage I-like protein
MAKRNVSGVAIGFGSLSLVEKEVPDRILILKAGDIGWANLDGFNMDAEQAAEVIADFKQHGTQIPIDYEHTSALEPGEKGIKAIAAGWITDLQWVEGEGLYATVEWTEQAKQEILTGQYKYYSPVITHDKKTNWIERLHSVALTNKPRTRNQRELLAASIGVTLERTEAGDKTMNFKELLTALKAVGVDLKDDAEGDVILAAAKSFVEAAANAKVEPSPLVAVAAKLGLDKSATCDVIVAKVAELQTNVPAAEYKVVTARLETLELAAKDRAGQELVADAIEAAKLNPNDAKQMTWARAYAKADAVGFKAWSDNSPALYSAGRLVTASAKLDAADDRQAVILAAKAEYADNPKYSSGSRLESWVDQTLRDKNMALLTATEKKAL